MYYFFFLAFFAAFFFAGAFFAAFFAFFLAMFFLRRLELVRGTIRIRICCCSTRCVFEVVPAPRSPRVPRASGSFPPMTSSAESAELHRTHRWSARRLRVVLRALWAASSAAASVVRRAVARAKAPSAVGRVRAVSRLAQPACRGDRCAVELYGLPVGANPGRTGCFVRCNGEGRRRIAGPKMLSAGAASRGTGLRQDRRRCTGLRGAERDGKEHEGKKKAGSRSTAGFRPGRPGEL